MDNIAQDNEWKAYIERSFIDILNNPDSWHVMTHASCKEKCYIKNLGNWTQDVLIHIVVDPDLNDWKEAVIERHFDPTSIRFKDYYFTGQKIIIRNDNYGD